MTLHERVSLWPRRKRMYGFIATMTVVLTVIGVVCELYMPGILSTAAFWKDLRNETVFIIAVLALTQLIEKRSRKAYR